MIQLIIMLFLHIVGDYYLQGCLVKMKKKEWWEENKPLPKCKYDYLMALFMHSFSWSFVIMIPIITANVFLWWVFLLNIVIHFIVEHLRENVGKINLIVEQTIHIIQVVLTWLLCFIIFL